MGRGQDEEEEFQGELLNREAEEGERPKMTGFCQEYGQE